MHILIAAIYIHCTSITSYVPHNISDTNTDCILLGQDVTNGIGGHIRTNIIHFTYISFAHRELTIVDVLHDSITLEQPWVQDSITAFLWWEFIHLRWIYHLAGKTWWSQGVTAPSPRWSHNENLLGKMKQTSEWPVRSRWSSRDYVSKPWAFSHRCLSLST